MKLMDLLDGYDLHKLSHQNDITRETEAQLAARRKRLEPLLNCFKQCIQNCGPCTNNPLEEYALMCTTAMTIDYLIEKITEGRVT